MRPVDHHHSDAILGAMRQVALARGGPITYADTASILAAGRYLLRRPGLDDIDTLPAVDPADLVAALEGEGELAREAGQYLAVIALVGGKLDANKIAPVLDYAPALDVQAAHPPQIVPAASRHLT